MRIHKPLYRALVKATRESHRSISEEAEFRLDRSFLEELQQVGALWDNLKSFIMAPRHIEVMTALERIEQKIENLRQAEADPRDEWGQSPPNE
jgi:hypothetical protein